MEKVPSVHVFVSSDIAFDQRILRTVASLGKLDCSVSLEGRRLGKGDIPDIPGVQIRRSSLLFRRGALFYLELNLRYLFIALCSKNKFFWVADLDALPGVWIASRIRNKRRIIFDAHEHYVESPELTDRPIIKRVWSILANLCIPRVDLAITVNELLAERLTRLYRVSFHSIRNMPDVIEVHSDKKLKVIWYQGAVNQGRCLELLIDTLEFLPDFTVEIAGTGDLFDELNSSLLQKPYGNRVIFHGRMPYSEMQKRASECFVGYNVLEHLGENYYYSLANKFFDYVQASLPSINPCFPLYEKYLDQYQVGIATDSKDARALAREIQRLWEDEEKYQHFKSECRRAAKVWNWGEEEKRFSVLMNDFFQQAFPKHQ